ncbi:MAG: aromatic acid exporter family protein [Clostridiaceae bacterium]|nr:aromatic acid exporter family protein [Clostridiaceae bacterium]
MFKLLRGVKIALAALVSIILADFLGLEYATAAGIVAILTIPETYQRTINSVIDRFKAFALGFLIAIPIFYFLGYSVWTFFFYLIIYAPLAIHFSLEVGLGPVTVLVTHLLSSESIAPSLILNEFLLLTIGHFVALLFNFFMPSQRGKLIETMKKSDAKLEEFLRYLMNYLNATDFSLNNVLRERIGSKESLSELEEILNEGREIAIQEIENKGLKNNQYYVSFFNMRKSQLRILEQISYLVLTVQISSSQNKNTAGIIEEIIQRIDIKESSEDVYLDVQELQAYYRTSELPASRPEFENRATNYAIINYLIQFINVRTEFRLEYEIPKKRSKNNSKG